MRSLIAFVDRVQIMDSFGFDASTKTPRVPDSLRAGLTIRTQLRLMTDDRFAKGILSVDGLDESSAVNCNLSEFLSQPLPKSPLTHLIGRVRDTSTVYSDPSRLSPDGVSRAEILVDADGVPILIPMHAEGRVTFGLPKAGELIHVCGALECLLSFSVHRLSAMVDARIVGSWRCPRKETDRWEIWGLVRVDLDPGIPSPEISTTLVHGGDGPE